MDQNQDNLKKKKKHHDFSEIPPDIKEVADELLAEKNVIDLDNLPDDMSQWMQKSIQLIDRLNRLVGRVVSIITLPIIFVMVYEISARYFFLSPTMWAYDLSRMFYGALFTLGAAHALSEGIHIRADFIYRNWSEKRQALVDLVLYIFFFFPGMLAFFFVSLDFSFESWQRSERSMDTAWMPMVSPIKSVLPFAIFLLLLQGYSEILKCWYSYKKGKWLSTN